MLLQRSFLYETEDTKTKNLFKQFLVTAKVVQRDKAG